MEKKVTQNDLLATARNDVVDDASEDENAENGTVGWMSHELKFVKQLAVSVAE